MRCHSIIATATVIIFILFPFDPLHAQESPGEKQFQTGLCFLTGVENEQSYQEAARHFQMAADQGHADARYHLSVLYSFGLGVRRHDTKAYDLCWEAAGDGHGRAQHMLGMLYLTNLRGANQDIDEATRWFSKATEQNVSDARRILTIIQLKNKNVDGLVELSNEYLDLLKQSFRCYSPSEDYTPLIEFQLRWKNNSIALWDFFKADEQTINEHLRIHCTPAGANGVVCFSHNNELRALDAQSGELKWRYVAKSVLIFSSGGPTPQFTGNKHLVQDNTVYGVTKNPTAFRAFDLATGRVRWTRNGSKIDIESPISAKDVVCTWGSSFISGIGEPRAWVDWSYKFKSARAQSEQGTSPDTADPLSDEEVVCVGDPYGYLHALEAKTGRLLWKFDLKQWAGGNAVIHDGIVYVTEIGKPSKEDEEKERYLHAIDLASGKLKWKLKTWIILYPLVVHDDCIYFVDIYKNLTVFDVDEGWLKWCWHSSSKIRGEPAIHEGILYLTNRDHILAFDTVTGEKIGEHQADIPICTPPFIMDDILFLGSSGIYAFDILKSKK